jgi:ATP-binding cassette subfamily C protein
MRIISFTRRLLKEQPLRFPLLIFLLVAVGFFEGFSIALIIPLLRMVRTGGSVAVEGANMKFVYSIFSFLHLPFTLGYMLAFLFFLILVQQGVFLLQQKLSYGSIYGFEAKLRIRLFQNILQAKWPFFTKEKIGHIVDALTVEANDAGAAYRQLIELIAYLIIVLVYMVAAFILSWQLAALAVLGALAAFFFLRRRVMVGAALGKSISAANAELQSEALEEISGVKLIKSTASEMITIRRFSSYVRNLAHSKYRDGFNQAFLRVFFEPLTVGLLCIGIYLAVVIFRVSIEKIIVFLFIFYRISPRISNLQRTAHRVYSLSAALERIDRFDRRARDSKEVVGTKRLEGLQREINFKNVEFSYSKDGLVLKNINLTIPKGKTIAIVGPSGAGKSTIVDLIMGLIIPDAGIISIDGEDIKNVDIVSWRQKIGYVTQDAVFFHASVRENLTWVFPEASQEDIDRAVKIAYADEFIKNLPRGYNTVIGDRGMRLSGGQKQRLALARAIVRNPEILILDEATSALDAESEEKIQKAIDKLSRKITIIIVTHRLATVKNVDYIYFIENGKIVEQGTWNELIEKAGRFKEMMSLQELGLREKKEMADKI